MTLSYSRVFAAGPAWFRGDFHAHTTCSDGAFSPKELSDLSVEHGLDFLAITDHNTLRAFDDFDDSYQRMIFPGTEITVVQGHCNVFGFDGNVAWVRDLMHPLTELPLEESHSLFTDRRDFQKLIDRVAASGLFVSIDHPVHKPWEWQDDATPISLFQGIELINDPTYKDGPEGNTLDRRLWSSWLNAGHRVTALGGSDFHSLTPADDPTRLMRLDLPLTYVYAAELSCRAMLEALRARHTYVTMGPKIEFKATLDGKTYVMGDDLGVLHSPARLFGRVEGCATPAYVCIIRNGRVITQAPVENGEAAIEWEIPPGNSRSAWYQFDVLGMDDQSIAVSNPFFVGEARQPEPRTFGSFPEVASIR